MGRLSGIHSTCWTLPLTYYLLNLFFPFGLGEISSIGTASVGYSIASSIEEEYKKSQLKRTELSGEDDVEFKCMKERTLLVNMTSAPARCSIKEDTDQA